MKRIVSPLLVSFFLLSWLPSCGRLIDWGKETFYQGEDITSYANRVTPFIRSITIYDQLETKAMFNVLWLNDEVRSAYADLHILRQAKSEEKLQAFLRRQLEENNHYFSFYVLSTHDVKLGVSESHWAFFLRLDGREYHPFEIKEIELPYEYQIFFGNKWNRFKVPYLIRFRAEDVEGNQILTDDTNRVNLIARSAQKEHDFIWQLIEEPEQKVVVKKKRKKVRAPKERVPRKRIRK